MHYWYLCCLYGKNDVFCGGVGVVILVVTGVGVCVLYERNSEVFCFDLLENVSIGDSSLLT